jgi:hypothetical protein
MERIVKKNNVEINERQSEFQQDKVLLAEDSIYQGMEFDSVEEASDFINEIVGSKWWMVKFPFITQVYVELDYDKKLKAYREGHKLFLRIPESHFNEKMVLELLARSVIPEYAPYFGREYCKVMLKIYRRFMDPISFLNLRNSYKSNGVKYRSKNDFMKMK